MASGKKRHVDLERNYRGLAVAGLEQIKEWNNIASKKKEAIIFEFAEFFAAQERETVAKLDKARHLRKAQALLGHGNFDAAAKIFGLNCRTAYRLISMAEKVEKSLPAAVLVLMPPDLGGIDPKRPYGNYQDAIEANWPPPKGDNPVKAGEWVQKVMGDYAEGWGERHKGKIKPKGEVTENLFKVFSKGMRQVNEEDRLEVAEAVIGMILSELGINKRTRFEPVAIPSTYVAKRGRPPKPDLVG